MRVRGYTSGVPCWTELACPDPAGSLAFYRDLLGWSCPDGATFERDGLAVAGVRRSPDTGWLSFVSTADADAAAGAAAAAGGTVRQPPTADEAGRGRTTLFADPDGAVLGAWQPGSLAGAQVTNEPDTVCWTDLVTPDLAGAAAFYRKLFGWERRPAGYVDDYDEWAAFGRPVAGLRSPTDADPPGTPAYWSVTLLVSDCRRSVERAVELGGSQTFPTMDMPIGSYAGVADPQGAAFGVMQLAPDLLANVL